MNVREILTHRKLGWLAVIGPLFALCSIAFCVLESPWFTWRDNAVSDFGVHSVAPLFNTSLIVCGIMCAVFAIGAMLRSRSPGIKFGMSIFLLASISLVGIGIFTEDWSPHHYFFSVAFFVLLLIAALLLSPHFLLRRETRLIGIFGLCVVALGIFGWAYHFTVGWGSNVAIPEALTFVPGALWFAMLGAWYLKRKGDGKVRSPDRL